MKSQKGQATVELALSLTVLFLILFGIIDFGRIFHSWLVLDHAGREAARIASLGGTDAEVRNTALNASSSLVASNMSMSITPSESERTRGIYTMITLTYSIPISTPLMAQILPNPFNITSKTVMRVE
jgi:Flp pilus assembly protein TadG